jgi:HSP20 family protein
MTVQITTSRRSSQPSNRSISPSPFRLFEDFLNDWAVRSLQSGKDGSEWIPAVDILEREGHLILKMELPGVQEKDIGIKLAGNVLSITGEKRLTDKRDIARYHQSEIRYGSLSRSFTLPDSVDAEKIEASFKNGVLTISLPSRAETKSRSIKLNAP